MDEPLYFTIAGAETWAMESTVRNRLLALSGVSEVRVRLAERRITVLGEDLDAEGIVEAARQAGCELRRETPVEEHAGAAWPGLGRRPGVGPLGGAWLACIAGLGLAIAERLELLPAMAAAGAAAFWLAVAAGALVLGAAVVRACLAAARGYPGTAVLCAVGVLCLGALVNWSQTLLSCLYLAAGCGPSDGYLDTALVAVGAAGLAMAVGCNSWRRVQAPLLERLPQPPRTVRVLRDGLAQSLELERLRVGALVHAVTGDAIAADGVVTRGRASVDESAITGRSDSLDKGEGDEVLAGSRIRHGDLVYCVNRTGAQTALAALLEAAFGQAPARRRLAEAGRALGLSAMLAVVAATAWQVLTRAGVNEALQVGVTVFMFAATAGFLWDRSRVLAGCAVRLARAGVVVRAHDALAEVARLRTVFFDQGLSLTVGAPQVMGVEPDEGVRVRDLFTLAASVEADSRHPLAEAVIAAALERDLPLLPSADFQSWPQEGVAAVIEGHRVLVGNGRLMRRFGVPSSLEQRCAEMAEDGRAVVHVAVDGRHFGVLAVEDTPAPGAVETIRGLVERGMEPVMLTGASRRSALGLARHLGIERVHAELSPEEKLQIITSAGQGGAATVVRAGTTNPPTGASLTVVVRESGERLPSGGAVVLLGGLRGLLGLADEARVGRAALRRSRLACLLYLIIALPLAAGAGTALMNGLIPSILAPIAAAAMVLVLDSLTANTLGGRWSIENE